MCATPTVSIAIEQGQTLPPCDVSVSDLPGCFPTVETTGEAMDRDVDCSPVKNPVANDNEK